MSRYVAAVVLCVAMPLAACEKKSRRAVAIPAPGEQQGTPPQNPSTPPSVPPGSPDNPAIIDGNGNGNENGNGNGNSNGNSNSNGDGNSNGSTDSSSGVNVVIIEPDTAPNTPSSGGGAAPQPNAGGGLSSSGNGRVKLNELTFAPPSGWSLAQQAAADGIVLASYARGDEAVTIYSKSGTGLTTSGLFANGAQVVAPEASKGVGNYTWKVIETTRTVRNVPHAGTYCVYGFLMERGPFTYYGYARGASADAARNAALAVLETVN